MYIETKILEMDPNFFGKADKLHDHDSGRNKLAAVRKQREKSAEKVMQNAGLPNAAPLIIKLSEKGTCPYSDNQFLQHRLC